MVLGFTITGQDNDSYLKEDLYGKNISECIDYIANREKYITEDFRISKTKYDYSYTYDGALIISQRFKDFCEKLEFTDIEFHKLQAQPNFYLFKVNSVIEFDSERRKTRFLEYNEKCGEYNEVVGAVPVCLKDNQKIKKGFYRTDIEFGRGYAKSPLIIVDKDIYKKIQKEKFKGLYGEKILDKYNWEK